jgi:hypothetical protein
LFRAAAPTKADARAGLIRLTARRQKIRFGKEMVTLVLAFCVIVLAVLHVRLYRQVAALRGETPSRFAWPLRRADRGASLDLPPALGTAYTGLVLLVGSPRGSGAYAAVAVTVAVARRAGIALTVMVDALDASEDLPLPVRDEDLTLPDGGALRDQVLPRDIPVLLCVADGRLEDATAHVQEPLQLGERLMAFLITHGTDAARQFRTTVEEVA